MLKENRNKIQHKLNKIEYIRVLLYIFSFFSATTTTKTIINYKNYATF